MSIYGKCLNIRAAASDTTYSTVITIIDIHVNDSTNLGKLCIITHNLEQLE
jgi:hypothetical protein